MLSRAKGKESAGVRLRLQQLHTPLRWWGEEEPQELPVALQSSILSEIHRHSPERMPIRRCRRKEEDYLKRSRRNKITRRTRDTARPPLEEDARITEINRNFTRSKEETKREKGNYDLRENRHPHVCRKAGMRERDTTAYKRLGSANSDQEDEKRVAVTGTAEALQTFCRRRRRLRRFYKKQTLFARSR